MRRSRSPCGRQTLVQRRRFRRGLSGPAGNGASDATGQFRFDVDRALSAHHAEFCATAPRPGYGVGWADLDPDQDQPTAEIRLMLEQVIKGRLFDMQGQPVPGAVVSASAICRTLPPTVLMQGRVVETNTEGPAVAVVSRPSWSGLARSQPRLTSPAPLTLRGIGRGLHVRLSVLDPRFAPQTIEVATDDPAGVTTVTPACSCRPGPLPAA